MIDAEQICPFADAKNRKARAKTEAPGDDLVSCRRKNSQDDALGTVERIGAPGS